MQKKGFIPYDGFKLLIAILLLLAIIILWITLPDGNASSQQASVEETEEVAATAEPTPQPVEETEEEETDESSAEMDLPPLPEPSVGLEYDSAKGGIVNADGELVYTLNEDGIGWTPVIPDELASMQLEGEWSLLDEDGNLAYEWNSESQSWVEVMQEEEPTAEEQTNTNIVDCPGAADPRLEGGKQAEVLRNVNFRSSPGIGDNWIGGFVVGDQVAVMGDTACTPRGSGAYRWWEVERADGTVGWIAEAAANSPNYFLGPVE